MLWPLTVCYQIESQRSRCREVAAVRDPDPCIPEALVKMLGKPFKFVSSGKVIFCECGSCLKGVPAEIEVF